MAEKIAENVRPTNRESVRMNHHPCWMYGVNIKVVVFETFCGICFHIFVCKHGHLAGIYWVHGIIVSHPSRLIIVYGSGWKKKNIVVAIKTKPVCTAILVSLCVWVFFYAVSVFSSSVHFFPLHFNPLHPDLHHLHFWNLCGRNTFKDTKWQCSSTSQRGSQQPSSQFIHSRPAIETCMSCDMAWKIVVANRTKRAK